MAFRGQVLVNPVSGERFIFHTTAGESRGALLEFDMVVEPNGRVPGGMSTLASRKASRSAKGS